MSPSPRLDLATWRAALWALRAKRSCSRTLGANGAAMLALPALPMPPALPGRARRGVEAVLARTGATCLERSSVLQTWDLAHDRRREVIVGVTRPSTGFRAHAWLEGDETCESEGFTELLRLPPPGTSSLMMGR